MPPLIAVLMILTVGCSMLLSSLYVRFRDIAQIWSVLTRAGWLSRIVMIWLYVFTVNCPPLLSAAFARFLDTDQVCWQVDSGE